ncbi:MAG TPA: hypothetical protein VFX85_06620 [Solirubrobacterales bacterium]|nr:hypothetical protein [Solirubrobacterales bacterium]
MSGGERGGNLAGWQQSRQHGNARGPLRRRCGGPRSRGCTGAGAGYVVVYRRGGKQRKEARAERSGPVLHEHLLAWVETYAGSGHDTVSGQTRREYRRLLVTFALRYFSPKLRLRELDRAALAGFVTWFPPSSSCSSSVGWWESR